MSTKEFIKKQVEKFSKPLTPEQFSELSETENSLIILEIPLKDYTLTEIARIVESNNAHIISLSVLPISGGSELLVSLKLDISDLTSVLRSFERFNYIVTYYFMKEGEVTDKQKERLDELMYYLEM
jgi:DNA-binding MarR family transcriptional regulator